MKAILLLLSWSAIASAKRLTRSGYYVPPATRYIPNYNTQPSYEYLATTPSPIYKPIYENVTPQPVTSVYHEPVLSSTPLSPFSSVTPSPIYDEPSNYVSITESTRPRFLISNQYDDNHINYVSPSSAPFTVPVASRSYIAPAAPVYNTNGYISPYSGSSSGDYGIYQYAPAFYNYKYDVKAPEYGVNFGHQEDRQGDVTRGSYHVLLPDGRLQIVEYTADSTGYHPRIRYVYVGPAGLNGYY